MRRYNVNTTKEEVAEEDKGREVYYFVAKRNKEIIGVSSAKVWPEYRHHIGVHFWAVKVNERGKGIGKKLLEKIYDFARSRNESLIFAAVRPAAKIMYEACGFTRVLNMDEIPYKNMMLIPYERIV